MPSRCGGTGLWGWVSGGFCQGALGDQEPKSNSRPSGETGQLPTPGAPGPREVGRRIGESLEQLKAGERPERVKPRGVVVGSGYFPLKAGPGGAVRVTGRLVVQGGGSHD